MNKMLSGLLLWCLTSIAMAASEHPGKAVYDASCASCHNNPEETKSPDVTTLQRMRYQTILFALNQGKMQTQAAALSTAEKANLIEYLVGQEQTDDSWLAAVMCSDKKVALSDPVTVGNFGFNLSNTRQLSAAQTGLTTAAMEDLELAWSIGFPGATTMRSQAAVMGSTLFLPVADAYSLYAIDVSGATPCFKWVFKNEIPLRSSAALGTTTAGREIVVFADLGSNIHALDAGTGEPLWQTSIGLYQFSVTTGTPVIHAGRVYAPLSQYEISVAADPKHLCCITHGAVFALDATSGEIIWTTHTMPEAKPVRDRGDGQMIWGPSGAPIWNSPAIDPQRGLLFVGTGEATSEPAHPNTDSILALDLKDGAIRWSFQATEKDIFLSGCSRTPGLNCPRPEDTVNRDVDFGASMILAQQEDGPDLLLAGQKSGTLWALNPDTGKLVWRRDFGTGSPLGGIHWGIAYDGEQVYAPINRANGRQASEGVDLNIKPGINAVDVKTGKVNWTFHSRPDCDGDREQRIRRCTNNIGLSGAPTVIDGAVVEGSIDGFLRIFDKTDGKVLFTFDTARAFATLNKVKASGGSIDNASIVAANGYLFVNSGYGMFGQTPGNVLLAFKKKTNIP